MKKKTLSLRNGKGCLESRSNCMAIKIISFIQKNIIGTNLNLLILLSITIFDLLSQRKSNK